MQEVRNHYLAARAKHFVRRFANHFDDPEFLVRQRDISRLTTDKPQQLYEQIRRTAKPMRMAFEATDGYERGWYLFWARYENAVIQSPLGLGRFPGVISMAKDSDIDRNINFVQTHLLGKMAVCGRGKACANPCFFRTRKGQKYCSRSCSDSAKLESRRKYWHKTGKQERAAKRTA